MLIGPIGVIRQVMALQVQLIAANQDGVWPSCIPF